MTRFARVQSSTVSQKVPLDASKWSEIKVKKHKNDTSNKDSNSLVKNLNQLKKDCGNLTDSQKKDISDAIKKDDRRERRRLKRINKREMSKVCFNCRKPGHEVAECQVVVKDLDSGVGICFKCGSTEHTVSECTTRTAPGVFPYAKCFICEEMGHMSNKCPDNPRGLYPKGGCCMECGSVEHYKKDCPELQKNQGISDICLEKNSEGKQFNPDEEISFIKKSMPKAKPKGPKLVKF